MAPQILLFRFQQQAEHRGVAGAAHDVGQLAAALGNLVENAVDFARQVVTVRWRWDADSVAITVLDDGEGFAPEIIDRIGEPYMSTRQEGNAKGNSSGGGLGLGLFIAKTLLERSGATLTFRNASGRGEGAMVIIEWPRDRFLSEASAMAALQ